MTEKVYCQQTGKVAYKSKRAAYKTAAHVAKYTRQAQPRKVYKCKYCGDYHLSHASRRAGIRK